MSKMLKKSLVLWLVIWGGHSFAQEATKVVCKLNFGNEIESYPISDLNQHGLQGEWTFASQIQAENKDAQFAKKVERKKSIFLLKNSALELTRLCYQQFAMVHHPRALYFTEIKEIKAYKADDEKCNGHQIVVKTTDNFYNEIYPVTRSEMKKNLEDYNFAVVLEGMVYRSKKLGREGIALIDEELRKANKPQLKSIASIHVMGYGGEGYSFNLEEMDEAQRRGITFLYTYAYDPTLMVYMDGTDPSKVPENDAEHGNIYNPATVDKFVPDLEIRKKLKIDKSIEENRVVTGNTLDFLQSISNMIDAPWPLLIHCKGGRHKTGMFALILEYLAFNEAMADEFYVPVSVPLFKNRFARWLDHKGSLIEVFFGGPLYEKYNLHPAELRYFEHNKSVFREKNIEFVRGIISGKNLDTDELRNKWEEVQSKFRAKIRAIAPFAIGQY